MQSSAFPQPRNPRSTRRAARLASFCFLLSTFCFLSASAQTAPKLLPFQGRLTDQSGVAVTNGTRLVQFKIYDVPTGGSPVWAGELHRTTVNGGLVNVLLGSKTPFTGVDFDKTLYLEITADINGDSAITVADPPMLPRQAILPVVFAKEAADSRLLAGSDWTPLFGANNPNGSLLPSKIATNSLSGSQIISNSITAAQIQPGTITSTQIAPNTITESNLTAAFVQFLKTLDPPGTISAFGGSAAPDGWLLCDGRAFSSNSYPRLYSALGTAWGGGYTNISGVQVKVSGADFNLPELRGVFLRGVTGGNANPFADPDLAGRTNLFSGGNVGNTVASYQQDDFKSHTHRVQAYVTSGAGWRVHNDWGDGTVDSGAAGGSETRPKNAYVNYIIKY